MRTLLILGMFTASLAHASWNDYEKTRELQLDAAGIDQLGVESGAGSLEIIGVSDGDEITVRATILVPGKNEEKAQHIIDNNLHLTLEKSGTSAVLKGYFDDIDNGWGDSPSVRMEVRVPTRFGLDVEDRSGSIVIEDVSGNIEIDDGSGSIKMRDVGGMISIEDGSGSIRVDRVGGDISIEDGSGSITVREVNGSVTIDDGSGSVNVEDVAADFIVIDDGSGSVNHKRVEGRVENNS